MAHRGKVHPDLMGPPGPGRRLQERGPVEALADLEEGLGLLPGHGPHPDPRPYPPEGRVDGEPVVRHDAADQGQVPAVYGVAPEHGRQRLMGLIGGGHDHQARGPRIEPVHDAGTKGAAGRGERDPHPDQAVHQRPGESPRRGMGGQAGRLAHHQERRVAVPDLDGRALRRHLAHSYPFHRDPLATRQPMRLRPEVPVHANPPAGDGPLGVGSGQRKAVGDDGVQPARRRLELLGHLTPPAPGGYHPRRGGGLRSRWPNRTG